MSYGKMNTFIDIVAVENDKDSEGFGTISDTIIASVRAYKEERHGNEKWANRAVFSEATALFCFRRIPSIHVTAKMVIVDSDGRYEITGVEDVKGRGMYTDRDKNVLFSVIKPSEAPKLKRLISEIDPNAFLIVIPANDVVGEGFKEFSLLSRLP